MVGLGTAEILLLLHKYYGGIDWFEDKSVFLFVTCLENAIKKENAIPKFIYGLVCKITGQPAEYEEKKNMRTAAEIMKDYGLK